MSAGRESGISNPCEGWRLCVGCEPDGSDGAERSVEVEIANGVHISLCCSSDLGGVDLVMCDARSPGSAGFDQAFRFEEGVCLRKRSGGDVQVCSDLSDGRQLLSTGELPARIRSAICPRTCSKGTTLLRGSRVINAPSPGAGSWFCTRATLRESARSGSVRTRA